jgi:hypothetical protein
MAEDKQGNKFLMIEQDLSQLNPVTSIWIIAEHTGRKRIPYLDQDYY